MARDRVSSARLGGRIREARKARAWPQRQLAERADVSRPTIAQIEADGHAGGCGKSPGVVAGVESPKRVGLPRPQWMARSDHTFSRSAVCRQPVQSGGRNRSWERGGFSTMFFVRGPHGLYGSIEHSAELVVLNVRLRGQAILGEADGG